MTETKKARKTARKDMRFSVRNFGPILKAEIDLRPLTIFAGPSNTGKSYLAILLYSLFQRNTLIQRRFSEHRSAFQYKGEDEVSHIITSNLFEFEITEREIDEVISIMRNDVEKMNSEKQPCFSGFSSEVKEWVKVKMADLFKEIAAGNKENLCRCMGVSSLDELSLGGERNLSERLEVVIYDDSHTWSFSGKNTSINVDNINFAFNASLFQMPDSGQDIRSVAEKEPKGLYDFRVWSFWLSDLLNKVAYEVLKNINLPASYLPAARTGVMQSHQAIAGGLVHRAAFAEDIHIPSFSGILADFLQTIIQISGRDTGETKIGSIADDIEKDILKGEILVDTSVGYPRFSYKQGDVKMSLIRSSSMVSELAPVVLFLRNCVEEEDVFIIEEPEAHLHPAARRGIAKAITRLVRAGVKVVITTHSDYILDQLSNYIWVENFSNEDRRKRVDDEHLYLKEEEVGCYQFKPAFEGTIVEKIKFNKKIGILINDHEEVVADLHNETVGILDQIFPD